MRKVPQKKRAGILVLLAVLLVVFSYGYFRLFSISVRGLISEYSSFISQPEDTSQAEKPKAVAFGNPEARHDNLGSVKGVTSETTGQVRAVEDNITENSLVFRLRVFFLDAIEAASARFDTDVEVGNDLSVENDVVITNDLDVGGVLTVAGTSVVTGDLTAPNVIYSILAGDGISVSGDQDITITNADTGSAQNIFKNIKVGSTTISADDNDDTFTLEGGSGVSLSNSGKTITIAASGSDLNVSGWFDDGTSVRLVSSTDNVGIGTSTPGYKLHVIGNSYFSGVATFAGGTVVTTGINNSSGGITNAGSITGATGFTSTGTITFPDFSTGVLQTNVNGVVSSSTVYLGPGSSVVSGVLPVTNGGTGLSSLNTGDILYASASSTLAALGAGSDGEVLTISGGIPAWGTAGGSGPCATCLVNNPNSTQTITPQAGTATGLVVKQANSGSVDSFRVESFDGSSVYFRIDSSGNVALGDNTTSGTFTVSPASTDPITIDPVAQGAGSFEGTITSLDLTAARTWQFPDLAGVVCLSTGNCAGTSASIGGSGTTNYLTKWSDTYDVTTSIVYDDGNNVGIGTTTMNSLLDIAGTLNVDALASFGGDVSVAKHATISGSLRVDQAVDFNSTLGVSGAATFGNTLDVTGLATFNGNVGIGTATPKSQFHINAPDGVSPKIHFSEGGGLNEQYNFISLNSTAELMQYSAGFNKHAGDAHVFYVDRNSLEVFRIDGNGRVGVGDSTPDATIDAVAYQATDTLFRLEHAATSTGDYMQVSTNGDTTGNILRIDGTGNLGIGSTSPSQKLDVNGAIRLGAASANNVLNTSAAGASPTGLLYWGDRSICDSSGNCSGTAAGVGGSGTTNYVTKWSGTYGLTDSIIFDDGTNVGIGTTSPIGKLNVEGVATGKALTILNETGDQAILVASASGTNRFIIQNDGNVGIGTNAPVGLLHLNKTPGIGSLSLVFGDGDTSIYESSDDQFRIRFGGSDKFTMGNGYFGGLVGTDAFQIRDETPSSTNPVYTFGTDQDTGIGRGGANILSLVAGGVNGLNVNGSGNVGIGTTSPGYLLDVSGTAAAALFRSNNDGFELSSGAGGTARLGVGSGSNYVGSISDNDFALRSNNVDRLYILNTGNIGINSTSPGYLLDVNGTLGVSGLATFNGITNPGAGSSSERFGLNAVANGDSTVAIGNGATANAFASIAIGAGSSADGIRSIAIGNNAANDFNDTLAIGHSISGTHNALIIGNSATTGWYSTLIGHESDSAGGWSAVGIGYNVSTYDSSIAFGRDANATASNQLVAGSNDYPINELYFGKGIVNATPSAYTINGTGGSGTDVAAGNLVLAGGKATGNAVGGSILFQTSDAGASGTSLQSLTTKMTIQADGNVGIGSTSPGYLLDVADGARITGATATGGNGLLVESNGQVAIGGSAASLHTLTVDTSVASWPILFTNSTSNISNTLKIQNSGGLGADRGSSIQFLGTSGAETGSLAFAWEAASYDDSYFALSTRSGGSVGERLRINNAGNVGIGTISPTARLDLEGDFRVFGAATASASYAGGKALVVKGAASQTSNLMEWQDSTGGLMTAVTANGYLDFSSSPTPNTYNTIIKFNGWQSEGFENGVISISGGNRTFLNLVTDNSVNSLLSGGIDGESSRRFAMTGSGKWQVGGGSSTYDTTLERNSGGAGWLMTGAYNGVNNLTIQNTTADVTSTSSLLDLQLTDDNDADANFFRFLGSGGSPKVVWQAHGSGFPRLGINTSNPADTIHLKISGSVTTSMTITNEGNTSSARSEYKLDNDLGGNSDAAFGLGSSAGTSGVFDSRTYLRTDAVLNGISLITEGAGDDIRFFTAGNSLSELRAIIDGTGKFGLGNASPDGLFDVDGAVTGKALAILNETGDQNIFTASASGTTRFVIQNDGNVGIGTTTVGESLHTTGNILLENNQYLKAKVTGGTAYNLIGVTTGDNVQVGDSNYNRMIYDTSSRHVFNLGGSEVARISDGNLGIGSNAPATILDIRDTAATDTLISILGEDTGYSAGLTLQSGSSGANWKIISQETYLNNALLFGTGAPYSMVLTTDGKLGLGNTSPVAKLDVSGAVTGKALAILNETGDQDIIVASASGAHRFSVGNTGVVSVTNDYDQTTTIETVGYGTGSGWIQFQAGGTNGDIAVFRDCCNGVFTVSTTNGTSSFNYNLNVNDNFTVDTNTLVVNSTSNNVGIGSDTPAAKLDVAGNIGVGVYPNGRLYNNGDTDTYVEFGNNKARIQAGGVPSFEIDSTSFHGNWANQANMDFSWDGDFNDGVLFVDTSTETVGVGTSAPVSKFDVQGAVTGKALTILNETGDQNILTASASGTTRFVIQNDGNVGIGTSVAGAALDVVGDIYFDSDLVARQDTNTLIQFNNNDQMEFQAGGLRLLTLNESGSFTGSITGNQNSHNVDFIWRGDTNSNMFMLDASSENVGIGSATPGQTLDVVGSARFSAVGSGTYANDLNLTSDGTLTTSSSDIRLKKDLISMDDSEILSKVLQLQTYSFNWKLDGSSDIGMIAQEVDGIFPELTFTNQTDGYMGINYSRLPTLLVSALQEQQRQLQNLKIELDESGAVALALEEQVLGATAEEAPTAQEQLAVYLSFAEMVEVLKRTVFKARAQFLATVEFMQEVRFRGAVRFNSDTVGRFTLPADATRLKITFDSEFSQPPTVFLSAQQTVVGGYRVESVTKSDFIVTLTQAQDQEVVFDWLAVLSDTQGNTNIEVLESVQGSFESEVPADQSTQEPTPTSEPIPEPTISPEPVVEDSNSVATQSSQINTTSSDSTATQSGTLE